MTNTSGRPSLKSNFAWTTVGNLVYSGCQWGAVAVLAKLGSPEAVGEYAFALAVTAPVLMLAQLNLRAVIATDVNERHAFADYRRLRLAMLAAAVAVIAGLAAIRAEGGAVVIFIAGLAQAVEWVSDIHYGRLQHMERMDVIARSYMMRGLVGIAALGGIYWWTGSLAWALAGLLAARAAVLAAYDIVVTPADPRPAEGWGAQKQIAVVALPLGVVLMLNALLTNVPRYSIEASLGPGALGLFAAVATLVSTGNTLVNALGQAATPRLSQRFAAGDREGFLKLTRQLLMVGGAIGAAGLAFSAIAGEWVLANVYKPEYAGQVSLLLLMVLMATAGFLASLLGYAITAARCFAPQMPLLAAATIVTGIAAWLLVPTHGLHGAAMAVGAGSAAQLLGEWFILRTALGGTAPAMVLEPAEQGGQR